jgi:hypothetical protein
MSTCEPLALPGSSPGQALSPLAAGRSHMRAAKPRRRDPESWAVKRSCAGVHGLGVPLPPRALRARWGGVRGGGLLTRGMVQRSRMVVMPAARASLMSAASRKRAGCTPHPQPLPTALRSAGGGERHRSATHTQLSRDAAHRLSIPRLVSGRARRVNATSLEASDAIALPQAGREPAPDLIRGGASGHAEDFHQRRRTR